MPYRVTSVDEPLHAVTSFKDRNSYVCTTPHYKLTCNQTRSSCPLEISFLNFPPQTFAWLLSCLRLVLSFRTKWKRQNQLRLEQLRQQSSVEKELLSSGALRAAEGNPCCSSRAIARYGAQSPCSFLTSAAAAIFHNVTYVHGCQL